MSHSARPAGVHLRNLSLALGLTLVGCVLDLFSKHWIFQSLGMPRPDNVRWIVPNFFGLETSINTGALFGMGQGGVAVFAVISVVATLGVLWWLIFGGASHDRWMSVTLGIITGGILGNLYDRLGLWGISGVRDWILFRYKEFVWPNFNVADMLLVCGAALMMWHAFRHEQANKKSNSVTSHVTQ